MGQKLKSLNNGAVCSYQFLKIKILTTFLQDNKARLVNLLAIKQFV